MDRPRLSPSNVLPAPPADTLSQATVQRLILEARADDAGTRADAIDALAAAPATEAIPVLQKVLHDGDDIERQLALSSLHMLALRSGDSGGTIREALRQAAYDGGDEAVASGAQAALDDIERSDEVRDSIPDEMSGNR
jgi:hypothetical protein